MARFLLEHEQDEDPPILLKLARSENSESITLWARGPKDKGWYSLCHITEKGCLQLAQNIPSELGLKIDDVGQLQVVSAHMIHYTHLKDAIELAKSSRTEE